MSEKSIYYEDILLMKRRNLCGIAFQHFLNLKYQIYYHIVKQIQKIHLKRLLFIENGIVKDNIYFLEFHNYNYKSNNDFEKEIKIF
jgi:hypothetical protein